MTQPARPAYHDEDMLCPKEAAHFLEMSQKTLNRLRMRGEGPSYYRITTQIIQYKFADLKRWRESRRVLCAA